MDVGPQNAVQVRTDNALGYKAAGLLIEDQFPHNFWIPCVVHKLNLALRNMCVARNREANKLVRMNAIGLQRSLEMV